MLLVTSTPTTASTSTPTPTTSTPSAMLALLEGEVLAGLRCGPSRTSSPSAGGPSRGSLPCRGNHTSGVLCCGCCGGGGCCACGVLGCLTIMVHLMIASRRVLLDTHSTTVLTLFTRAGTSCTPRMRGPVSASQRVSSLAAMCQLLRLLSVLSRLWRCMFLQTTLLLLCVL